MKEQKLDELLEFRKTFLSRQSSIELIGAQTLFSRVVGLQPSSTQDWRHSYERVLGKMVVR